MNTLEEYTDVVVVGAGHAGCEAKHLPVQDSDFPQPFLPSVWTASR